MRFEITFLFKDFYMLTKSNIHIIAILRILRNMIHRLQKYTLLIFKKELKRKMLGEWITWIYLLNN